MGKFIDKYIDNINNLDNYDYDYEYQKLKEEGEGAGAASDAGGAGSAASGTTSGDIATVDSKLFNKPIKRKKLNDEDDENKKIMKGEKNV